MPTYEYSCSKCEKTLEVVQKITEDPLKKCPSCGNDSLQKLIGGGSALFQFKGKGFYQTDYRSEPKKDSCGCKSEHTCKSKN